MLIDIHLHSSFSFDSEENIENYVAAAKKSGATAIGFSEHYDYDAYLDGAEIELADIRAYSDKIAELRSREKRVDILYGIEFGYSKAAESEYKRLSSAEKFDYVINSVHTLPDRGDCYYQTAFSGLTTKQAYEIYFEKVLESLDANFDYQIVGHLGYVARYRKTPDCKILYEEFHGIIDEILKKIIELDKCLEINSSTGDSGNAFLPDRDVIERYISLGGRKMSFGSDAHRVGRYAENCDLLRSFLIEKGVSELCYFKDRKPVFYKI